MSRDFEASSNDYVEVGDVPALDLAGDEVALAAWVKIESTVAEKKAIAKWSDSGSQFSYLLSVGLDAGFAPPIFVVNTGSNTVVQSSTNLTVGVWHHIAGTYDGANAKIYVDGVEKDSDSASGNLSSNTAPVRIGMGSGTPGASEEPFDGLIGHCSIWDVGLSANEAQSLASGVSPLRIRRDNLLFYAPLNGQDPELDVVGGLSLTVNGPIKSEEPPKQFNSIIAP